MDTAAAVRIANACCAIFIQHESDRSNRAAWDTMLHAVDLGLLQVGFQHEYNSWTLLHCAAKRCKLKTFRRLLAAGAPPSLPDHRGNTPMHLACTSHTDALLKCQLLPLADLARPNANGDTALHLVAEDTERHETFFASVAHVAHILPTLFTAPHEWRLLRWMVAQEVCPLDATNHDGKTVLDLLAGDACAAPCAIVATAAAQRVRWSPARAAWTGAVVGAVVVKK
jgi:hypothetical protein